MTHPSSARTTNVAKSSRSGASLRAMGALRHFPNELCEMPAALLEVGVLIKRRARRRKQDSLAGPGLSRRRRDRSREIAGATNVGAGKRGPDLLCRLADREDAPGGALDLRRERPEVAPLVRSSQDQKHRARRSIRRG